LRKSAQELGPKTPNRSLPTQEVGSQAQGTAKVDVLIALDFLEPSARPGSLGCLGPYHVSEVLGNGGFGIVLKAFDPALNRSVAIKVLAPQLAASAAARIRFAREAKAAAAVVHENVVAIHAVDSWNGYPYLVMPCVAGRSLQERVDRDGPLAVKEVLRVGRQTALGLAAAHDQGLVHRDIKPSNILLENGVERVKLSDFGLARAVDDASQTQSGVIAGTPQYMSPEQARGESVDHRSDLFSLGGVMYFMCTGHPPFRADSTPAVLRRVCDDRQRPLREVNSEVPNWLADIVDQLLANKADVRFSSATEVADVLKHHLAELQRTGSSAPLRRITPRPIRNRLNTKSVVASLMTFAVICGLAMLWAPSRNLALMSFVGGGSAANTAGSGGGDAPPSLVDGRTPSNSLIIGSGRPATKNLNLADFESLDVMHPFRVEAVRSDRFEVTITADDNVLQHVIALKEGSLLKIALAEGKNYRLKADSLKATIGMPALSGVVLSHGARAMVRGFKSDRGFNARVSHGGILEGEVEAGDVDFEAYHGSAIQLRGKARDGRLLALHGSKLILPDLGLRAVEINTEHGSTSRFKASTTERVKVSASHAGIVTGNVEAGEVTVQAAHSAQVTLKGRAGRAGLEANHGCLLSLAGLTVDVAKVEMGHSSSATVNAEDTIDYELGHGSRLKYVGKPKVGLARSSGSSTVRSITAEEANKEEPVKPEEPSKPDRLTQEDIFISTVSGGSALYHAGDPATLTIVGSGQSASKAWELSDFSAVTIGSTFQAEIVRGDTFKVTTTSDDNVLEHLLVVKEGKTLTVGLVRGINVRTKEPLKARIVVPVLEGLDAGGASRVNLQGFRSERDFKLKLHGASKIEGSIEVGSGEFAISGACHLTLAGSAKSGRVSVSGASHLDLADFPLKHCEIHLSGASIARIAAQSGRPVVATVLGSSALSGTVDAAKVSLKLDGASVVNLQGKADSAVLEGAGSSHLGLTGLVVGEADVKLSDSSRAEIDARKRLTYVLSAGSRLEYSGDPPALTGSKSRGSTLRRR
jgi:serine/threonine-protein kinase